MPARGREGARTTLAPLLYYQKTQKEEVLPIYKMFWCLFLVVHIPLYRFCTYKVFCVYRYTNNTRFYMLLLRHHVLFNTCKNTYPRATPSSATLVTYIDILGIKYLSIYLSLLLSWCLVLICASRVLYYNTKKKCHVYIDPI